MKTITNYCCIFLLMVAAASCGKDSAGNNASHKVKSYVEDIEAVGNHTVQTYNVNYDEQDRITSIEATNKHGARMIYQYSAENSFTYDKYEDTVHFIHAIYFINSQSLIDSTWGHDYKQYGYKPDTTSAKFFYDENKKLVKQKQYLMSYLVPPVLYNTVTYQYDLKGTLTKESDSYQEISYGYDKALENTVQLEPFYFPFNKELPSHTFKTRLGITISTEHTYTFDDKKRLITEMAVGSDGIKTVRNYVYEQ